MIAQEAFLLSISYLSSILAWCSSLMISSTLRGMRELHASFSFFFFLFRNQAFIKISFGYRKEKSRKGAIHLSTLLLMYDPFNLLLLGRSARALKLKILRSIGDGKDSHRVGEALAASPSLKRNDSVSLLNDAKLE